MTRLLPRSALSRLILLALVGFSFVFATSACGDGYTAPDTQNE